MKKTLTGLDFKIQEMAGRIRELREISGFSAQTMALKTGTSEEEYLRCEAGQSDLNFAFLYRCALAFGVDVTDLIEGSSPKLRSYTLTRAGNGQKIEQAHEMIYYNMASGFQNRIADPLFVENKYSDEAFHSDIELTSHVGQECDLVIRGSMKVQVGGHTELLHEGDCIYYDSSIPHGMVAADGQDCLFYAIVLRPQEPSLPEAGGDRAAMIETAQSPDPEARIYTRFVDAPEDANGKLQSIAFKNEQSFNFAFDIVDALGREKPEKLAMLHVALDGTERRFTFKDMKDASSQAANYFTSLGIRRGDRVMLVLKRHYQFWFAILGLHKIGAIAIPATNQLVEHDFSYRFQAAGVSAVLCTADGDTAYHVDIAEADTGMKLTKIMVGGSRDGWHDFNAEYGLFSRRYTRRDDAPCGDEPMLMFFTSGTSGYPKIAAHNYKYPLGHFITAKYWNQVNPDGLHLTISDTGWAKSLWGKLYGQWLCEAAVFVYDFDRFDAEKILPMFAKYQITTFCAPPTMYRMLIKQDLSRFDLSSIQHASIAGEALNPEVFRQFEKATGMRIMEGFGQSESTLIIGNLAGDSHKIGSMGKPVPLYDVHLLDSSGHEAEAGDTGEICINIQNGIPCGLAYEYYNSPEVTAKTCDFLAFSRCDRHHSLWRKQSFQIIRYGHFPRYCIRLSVERQFQFAVGFQRRCLQHCDLSRITVKGIHGGRLEFSLFSVIRVLYRNVQFSDTLRAGNRQGYRVRTRHIFKFDFVGVQNFEICLVSPPEIGAFHLRRSGGRRRFHRVVGQPVALKPREIILILVLRNVITFRFQRRVYNAQG